MRKKHLLLINPKAHSVTFGNLTFVPELVAKRGLLNVALPTVAALTPRHWTVRIIDENVEPLPAGLRPDLVGITGYHTQVPAARAVAERFRSRGVPVVCGGPSVTISPERWRPFADVLVHGEAEHTWGAFLADFEAGTHRSDYHAESRPPLSDSPCPDYSGFNPDTLRSHFAGIVQTSRGCPHNCEFCDVIVYLGRRMRHKPIHAVLAEVSQLKRLGFGTIVLADDNFSGHRPRARRLLEALRNWNRAQRSQVIFFTQLAIDVAADDAFLRLAAEAGLTRVLVGIESPNPESLQEARKRVNLGIDLVAAVRRFHEHGIVVIGTSIVGFDHDTSSAFDQQFDFLMEAGIITPQVYPLHAPDGTPLKERLVREGRYLEEAPADLGLAPEQVNLYNLLTVKPANMSVAQLRDGLLSLLARLYEAPNVVARVATFLRQFEQSPVRGQLRLARPPLDAGSLFTLGRLVKYAALHAPSHERRAIWELAGLARRSSHPQAALIAASAFLMMKNVHGIVEYVQGTLSS